MTFRRKETRRQAAVLAGLMVLSALTEGAGLVMLVPLLEAVSNNGLAGSEVASRLAGLGLPTSLGAMLVLFVGLVVLRGIIAVLRNMRAIRFEASLADGLRLQAWEAMLHCDWRVIAGLRRSDSASLLISSLDRVGYGLSQLISALSALLTLVALAFAGLLIAPQVAAILVGSGLLVLGAYHGLRRRAARQGDMLTRNQAAVYASLGEGLAALRAIKSQQRESQAYSALAQGFARLADGRADFVRDKSLGTFALQAGGAAVLSALVWLAAERWGYGLATVLPLIALFARALPLLAVVQETWQNWAHARPALVEVQALIARLEAAREPSLGEQVPPRLARSIRLAGIGVQYAGQDRAAIDAASFTIAAGTITAFAGPSGAGKSTLADILAGLLVPDRGRVEIDGAALDPAMLRAWRGAVAYVEQDPVLLSASVRDNLLWAAPEASEQHLWTALENAAAADLVRGLPQGLDTLLGDGGRRLSGGERQRLMLARALLRGPQLLILDEATSALDPANEAAIAEALQRLRGRLTVVLICHRGALLALADRVVRLEAGRVVDES